MNHKTVVSGIGIVSSIGSGCTGFEASLRKGTSGIGMLPPFSNPELPVSIGAPIRDFSFDEEMQAHSSLPEELTRKAKQAARRSPFPLQVSVLSALEAWDMAGLSHGNRGGIAPERLGIIIAGHNVNRNYQYELNAKFRETPEYLSPRYALHFMDTDHVGTISEIFGIMGEGFTVGTASASGNAGIIKGKQLIELGLVDACMVVGVPADLSPMEFQAFYSLGAMGGKEFRENPEKACRPFDRDHEGFIYGQGGGCLVLESLESAKKRGAQILAGIPGASLCLDANRNSDPNEEGEIRVMRGALEQAEINPSAVDYINTHGSSSPLGDKTEIQALRQIFNNDIGSIRVNATKGLTGHCLYSAGVVEAVASIIQMNRGFLHPNRNLENPIDSDINFCDAEPADAKINIALSNSFGFGGINTCIVLEKGYV
ncbi:MAG: beta-ketoacyl-ACP synthase [bacterium]|nr:beta-ketoacyl-ACP synthase [bacterium]